MNATVRDRRIRLAASAAEHSHYEVPSEPAYPTNPVAFANWSTPTMNQTNSAAWVTYTYASFAIAAGMTAIGIWALPAELWVKGYLSMAVVYLIGTCFTLSKTLRDEHEGKRLANRIEEAKTEKILMGIDRG